MSKMIKALNIKVIPDADKPEPPEVLAAAIIRISDAMHKLADSGLNKRAIIALIADQTKFGKNTIEVVLDSLAGLRSNYCRK